MTKKLIMVAGLCAAVCLLLGTTAFGKAKSKSTETTVKGIVSVTKDASNVVASVKLATSDSIYDVVLNAEGLKIGNTMEGKKIKATGVVSQKGDQKWIEVKTFKAVDETKHKKHKKA